MNTIDGREAKVMNAGAAACGNIVAETARICGSIHGKDGSLNRAAGLRGGCTVMIPGVLAMASLIGLNKKGEVMGLSKDEVHTEFCNEASVLFATILMSNMGSEIISQNENEAVIAVEFSPAILSKTLQGVEKIYGPVDGKIDPTLLNAARESIAVGNQALDMLNRLVAAGRPN